MRKSDKKARCKLKSKWLLLLLVAFFTIVDLSLILRMHALENDEYMIQSEKIAPTHRSSPSIPTNSFYNGSLTSFYNIPSDGTNLWDHDPTLPYWMRAYFNWHKHKRKTWKADEWESERWMIMQCLADQDTRCGGTADRLKPLPSLLRLAYETKRILLIRWTKPAKLEEFLVPPIGGLDWRVPPWMGEIMSNIDTGKRLVPSKVLTMYAIGNISLIRTRYQSYNGGKDWYNKQLFQGEPAFDDVFHKVWKILFRPSIPVATAIETQLQEMNLIPGAYVSAHLRALYNKNDRDIGIIREWTENALNCASQLRPGRPIFFASDSANASMIASVYAEMKGGIIVTHTPNPNPPLHLDRCADWQTRQPYEFYDTFVDLYLLALGGCVTYNKGGYGHWSLLIGGNVSCSINQKTGVTRGYTVCDWEEGSLSLPQDPVWNTPLFPEIMD